ncbi:phage portal protein family protein [Candidatus Electronema sp. JM]|uniref:phage portal protein family protein n=1 Tax=Candidatus Electronema sp. JM TaxID=3401571 RepID=UPI003AA8E579
MPLLDQYGQPVRSIPSRIPAAKWLSNQRLEVWHGITPDKMAALFRRTDIGDLAAVEELYSALGRMDTQVHCETEKYLSGILSLEDQLTPASNDPKDNEICDFVRATLLEHPQWADFKATLAHARLAGVACAEPVWAEADGKVIIKEFRRLPISRLTYTGLDGLLLDWPLLLTDEQPQGMPIDPRNIVLHCGNSLAEHPVRQGALRSAAWLVMLKHYSTKDWWRFGEQYGIPWRLGKYETTASEEDIAVLHNALLHLGSDGSGAMPKSTEIELVQAAQAGSVSLFGDQVSFCDAAISKVINGGTLATDVGKNGGALATAAIQRKGTEDIWTAEGKRLAGAIMQQLVKPLVQLNYGQQAALPRLGLNLISQEDYEKKAKWFELVVDRAGVGRKEYYKQYGLTPPEIDADIIGGTGPAKKAPQMLSAKRPVPADPQRQQDARQAVIDRLAARAAEETAAEFSRNQAEIVAAVRKAKDWDEALAAVVGLYPELETKQLNRLLAQSMTAAQVYGRKTGQDDAAGRQDS